MTAIRAAAPADAEAIARIYAHYVEHTSVTFDLQAPSAEGWRDRMAAAADGHAWLVAEEDDGLAGFAYAGSFRPRDAYRPTVETTIYLAPSAGGRGLGGALYGALLERCQDAGFHTAVAGVTLPNAASVALHERLGYERVGLFTEVGLKFGRWHDVAFYLRRL